MPANKEFDRPISRRRLSRINHFLVQRDHRRQTGDDLGPGFRVTQEPVVVVSPSTLLVNTLDTLAYVVESTVEHCELQLKDKIPTDPNQACACCPLDNGELVFESSAEKPSHSSWTNSNEGGQHFTSQIRKADMKLELGSNGAQRSAHFEMNFENDKTIIKQTKKGENDSKIVLDLGKDGAPCLTCVDSNLKIEQEVTNQTMKDENDTKMVLVLGKDCAQSSTCVDSNLEKDKEIINQTKKIENVAEIVHDLCKDGVQLPTCVYLNCKENNDVTHLFFANEDDAKVYEFCKESKK